MTQFIPAREFSYATSEDSAYRRAVIHWIEQLTGKPRLRRLYEDYARGPAVGDFFGEAIQRLALGVRVHGGVSGRRRRDRAGPRSRCRRAAARRSCRRGRAGPPCRGRRRDRLLKTWVKMVELDTQSYGTHS